MSSMHSFRNMLLVAFLVALISVCTQAVFYLPGVAPRAFAAYDPVSLCLAADKSTFLLHRRGFHHLSFISYCFCIMFYTTLCLICYSMLCKLSSGHTSPATYPYFILTLLYFISFLQSNQIYSIAVPSSFLENRSSCMLPSYHQQRRRCHMIIILCRIVILTPFSSKQKISVKCFQVI